MILALGTAAGVPVLRAECAECGYDTAFLDPHPKARVEHRCARGIAGPTWLLVEPPETLPERRQRRTVPASARAAA